MLLIQQLIQLTVFLDYFFEFFFTSFLQLQSSSVAMFQCSPLSRKCLLVLFSQFQLLISVPIDYLGFPQIPLLLIPLSQLKSSLLIAFRIIFLPQFQLICKLLLIYTYNCLFIQFLKQLQFSKLFIFICCICLLKEKLNKKCL